MSELRSLAAFVMARGGSTRVKSKNKLVLGGKPCYAHTLDDAWEFLASLPDASLDVFLLSDDEETLRGAEAYAATCGASLVAVSQSEREAGDGQEYVGIDRVLNEQERAGIRYAYVMLLAADCPIRPAGSLQDAWRAVRAYSSGDDVTVQHVVPVPPSQHPFRMVTISECGRASLWTPSADLTTLSQDFPACYSLSFNMVLMPEPVAHITRRRGQYAIVPVVVNEPIVEIDTPADLLRVRQLFEQSPANSYGSRCE